MAGFSGIDASLLKGAGFLVYGRTSTEEQSSAPEQVEILKTEIATVGGIFVDAIIEKRPASADEEEWDFVAYLKRRPDLYNMMLELEKNKGYYKGQKVKFLAVWKYDRLSRNPEFSGLINRRLKKESGITAISLTESSIKLVRQISGIIAENETDRLKERLAQFKKNVHELGFWTYGVAPFGYKLKITNKNFFKTAKQRKLSKLFIVPSEAEAVKEAFRLFTEEGKGVSEIGRILELGTMKISRILQNRTYTGCIQRRGTLMENTHEAIISKETYEKAFNIWKEKKVIITKASVISRIAEQLK